MSSELIYIVLHTSENSSPYKYDVTGEVGSNGSLLCLGKAALAPNLAAMTISSEDQAKQRRAAEREARRYRANYTFKY